MLETVFRIRMRMKSSEIKLKIAATSVAEPPGAGADFFVGRSREPEQHFFKAAPAASIRRLRLHLLGKQNTKALFLCQT